MVEHLTADQEVTGSNPVGPYFKISYFFLLFILKKYFTFFERVEYFTFYRLFILKEYFTFFFFERVESILHFIV